jgi:UPF0042 nucleotide-binding protein
MHLVLISGLSGSGKSIALNVLEDGGYYCVDNLPSGLLPQLIDCLAAQGYDKVGVAMDVRGGAGIRELPKLLAHLKEKVELRFLFLDAKDDTLLKRFSETRRRHPLANEGRTLVEAIREERELLEEIATLGHHIDTSDLKAASLREWVKQFIAVDPGHGLTLLFQSFGFKHGIPLDADLVFDVRCLPNPHYDPELRPLTGRDRPVIDYLEAQPEVGRMAADIFHFVSQWLPSYIRDSRSYLTVAVGCTGGQHRSVYLAEWLSRQFRDGEGESGEDGLRVLLRHRQLAKGGK